MITFTDDTFVLYIRAAGRLFRVTAICSDCDEANAYCAANPEESVLAEDRQQGRVYIAEDKQSCDTLTSDHWEDDPEYPASEWRDEAFNDDTRLGYLEWILHKRESTKDDTET